MLTKKTIDPEPFFTQTLYQFVYTYCLFMNLGRFLGGLLIAAAFVVVPAGVAQAQGHNDEDTEDKVLNKDHDRIIKFRPFDIGQVSFTYEKLRSSRVSNELGIGYIYKSYLKDSGFTPADKKVNGLSVRMSQRHYTSNKKMAPFGFYHGPVFGYRLLIFEKDVFGTESTPPSDPNYRYIGRLYQNSIDLSYQIGGQFQLGKHLTSEIGLALGGRLKYARSVGAEEILAQRIIGHELVAEQNSAIFAVPLAQLNFSVGYSF